MRRVDPRTVDVQYRYMIRLHACAYIMRRVMQRVARYIILPFLSPPESADRPRDHAQVYRNGQQVYSKYYVGILYYSGIRSDTVV